MRAAGLQQRFSDLIAFQCVLVALRGVNPEASEEMLWQTLIAALVEQYGFQQAWYGRRVDGGFRPVVVVRAEAAERTSPESDIEDASAVPRDADLSLPVTVEGQVEGKLLIYAGGSVNAERAGDISMLLTEAEVLIAGRRARVRNEEALRQAKLLAESADHAKSLLLANMSHEIRTPMTAVLGFADLLVATPLNPEQRDYVETIRSSGEVLLAVINDILDFSKIGAGKLQLESLGVDIRHLVEKSIGVLAVQAAEKGLRLSFGIAASVPKTILGDAVRLRQILVNLLGNAVKFTDRGEVSLEVSARPDEDGKLGVSFAVRDTGPGIPPDQQQRIFDSFSQVDASISRKYGGTGLGLAISKSLVTQMGGCLRVESALGRGSTFYFTLPARMLEEGSAAVVCSGGLTSGQAMKMPALRTIVAEDNPVTRRLVLALLLKLGYRADSAVDGMELLECLARSSYDVIFMDVQMPGVDGLEATRRIRGGALAGRQPHIIAMTAAAFPEDRSRCLEAGMDDYVSKPVDVQELVGALRRVRAKAGG
jgi:signal transduction histidine kinase/CheY-like chemotaxis protein